MPHPHSHRSIIMGMKIPRRKLGLQGLEVSAIGLGCKGMSDLGGIADETAHLGVLNAALDIGINFLDTADAYGNGASERMLAKILRIRRRDVVLATKFGTECNRDGAYLGVHGTPERVHTACDASLERLGVDHIDLYYLHCGDLRIAVEETVGAMADLVKAGKVRHLGLSGASAKTIRRAEKVHPIAALQSEYSLWMRDLEPSIMPLCEELGIGVVAHSPLGRGFLAEKSQGENSLGDPRLAEAVLEIANEAGYTPAQVALAWLLDCAPYVVPIPGTRNLKHLKENTIAVMVRLDDEHLEQLYGLLREQSIARV
jgi:aryl-alcohol dehydrogenase-like predicted oxidoreductase